MKPNHLEQLIGSVKAANLAGRLYLQPRSKRLRAALMRLTREGRVLPVPATATSLAGYKALQ